jgi:hypothetical protein
MRARSDRGQRLPWGTGKLPRLCQLGLSVGAPDADHAAAEGTGGRRLAIGRPLAHAGAGLDLYPRPLRNGHPVNGAETLSQVYVAANSHETGRVTTSVLLGQGAPHHRLQRVRRNHPHIQHQPRAGLRVA